MGIKFDKGSFSCRTKQLLDQNYKCLHCYDLDAQPRNLTNNFKFKNYLFGATSVVKHSDKEKYVCSGYGITFDCKVSVQTRTLLEML